MTEINIQSGRLKHILDIQSATKTRDAAGGVVETFTNVKTGVHCEVRPVSAREIVSGDQITQDVTHIIRHRYLPSTAITPSMRYVWGSRVFNVQKVINAQEQNILLEVTVIENLNVS